MTRQGIFLTIVIVGAAAASVAGQAPTAPPAAGQPGPTPSTTSLGSDSNGNPLRRATKTGHVSNYDEAKVPPYTLPELLKLSDGTPVRDAGTWQTRRRPEIIKLYESQIFGRLPAVLPKVEWRVTETDPKARDGQAVRKQVVGTVGSGPRAVRINLAVYTPAGVTKRVPVILLANFGGGNTPAPAPPARGSTAPALPLGQPPVAAEILARGWGFATLQYQDIQPDRANALTEGVIGLTLAQGQTEPAPDEWGAITAWAWGISRAIDYLASDASIDPGRIALQGHSRLGKTALWASATDQRIAAVFASCAGEMGSALSRRDWGETVDDMAQNFPWWFAGNFQEWAGRWNDMPVDAHMLIALSAPRPVFLTGGTGDQWADPVGEFKAEVAAGPVYRLLGRKDLGVTTLPPLDTPVTAGDLGWHYHTGPHTASPADWAAFLTFLDKYFK
jgi:(4-O-methyl)-D-glucuronate---lignin esterase